MGNLNQKQSYNRTKLPTNSPSLSTKFVGRANNSQEQISNVSNVSNEYYIILPENNYDSNINYTFKVGLNIFPSLFNTEQDITRPIVKNKGFYYMAKQDVPDYIYNGDYIRIISLLTESQIVGKQYNYYRTDKLVLHSVRYPIYDMRTITEFKLYENIKLLDILFAKKYYKIIMEYNNKFQSHFKKQITQNTLKIIINNGDLPMVEWLYSVAMHEFRAATDISDVNEICYHKDIAMLDWYSSKLPPSSPMLFNINTMRIICKNADTVTLNFYLQKENSIMANANTFPIRFSSCSIFYLYSSHALRYVAEAYNIPNVIDILEWFYINQNINPIMKYTFCKKNVKNAVTAAYNHGNLNVIEWFWSKLLFNFSKKIIHDMCVRNNIVLLEKFFQKVSIEMQALKLDTSTYNKTVIQWLSRNGIALSKNSLQISQTLIKNK